MTITVREYARLTTDAVPYSLDCAQVPPSAFDWLCKVGESFSRSGAALFQLDGRRSLKLDNYVGVMQSPCGTRLEILPKHYESGECEFQNRALLRKMIQVALDLPTRDAGQTSLDLFDAPLSEWVMGQFLQSLDHLVKRGFRFDYQRFEEEQRYLRGQLNVAAQVRQLPGRQHHFQIRHDEFVPDRPENRLIKLALLDVCQMTQDAGNWRLAHELRSLLEDIPASRHVGADFQAWRSDRLMAHYQPLKPWCELILDRQMPLAIAGRWQGMSLLFPMERLFERYVAVSLRRSLHRDARMTAQAASKYLCEHIGAPIFRLEPDLLVQQGAQQWILDTKWKRLDAMDRANKYGLSQVDFYQLYAYGQKYLNGAGEMVLIYPKWSRFTDALPEFTFDGGLRLHVLPFDLGNAQLMGIRQTTLPMQSVAERFEWSYRAS